MSSPLSQKQPTDEKSTWKNMDTFIPPHSNDWAPRTLTFPQKNAPITSDTTCISQGGPQFPLVDAGARQTEMQVTILSRLVWLFVVIDFVAVFCTESGQKVLLDPLQFSSNNSLGPYVAPWETLPPTPSLPSPKTFEGFASINGIDLWYAIFGLIDEFHPLPPVVFIHGGFANSGYWGHQVKYLLDNGLPNAIITVDSRAQGRSSDDLTKPITYDAMTDDVVALMDYLGISKFSVIGWSDGGAIALNLCMHHSERIDRIFSFGGLYHFKNNNETLVDAPVSKAYFERAEDEYQQLSTTPDAWDQFKERMMNLWDTGPTWDAQDFQSIPSIHENSNAPLIWIVSGDSEEIITRNTPSDLFAWIWGSSWVQLPGVSHFGFLQDPETFNVMLSRWVGTKRSGLVPLAT